MPTKRRHGTRRKDTAGPAVNPLLKVMNMVAVLAVPLMAPYDAGVVKTVRDGAAAMDPPYSLPVDFKSISFDGAWYAAGGVSVALILWAMWQSKKEGPEMA